MKRTAIILGIAAAMGVFAPTASGSARQPVGQADSLKAGRKSATDLVLHATYNSRSGQMMYRLGSSGLWME
jgi:hypothetical protein